MKVTMSVVRLRKQATTTPKVRTAIYAQDS